MSKLHYLCLEQNRMINENQEIDASDSERRELTTGFPYRRKPFSFMRFALHTASKQRLEWRPKWSTNGNDRPTVGRWSNVSKAKESKDYTTRSGTGRQSHHGTVRTRKSLAQSHRIGPAARGVRAAKGSLAESSGKEASESTFKRFFIRIGPRYRRIKKNVLKGKPSRSSMRIRPEKLQELETFEKAPSTSSMVTNLISARKLCPLWWSFAGETFTFLSKKPTTAQTSLHD